ncbi:hypothetical protein PMI09_03265 [Rhizobium sp. CF122]|nr:hypothetical protein PMI09_03265 [Rhizobium sp. CF122]
MIALRSLAQRAKPCKNLVGDFVALDDIPPIVEPADLALNKQRPNGFGGVIEKALPVNSSVVYRPRCKPRQRGFRFPALTAQSVRSR